MRENSSVPRHLEGSGSNVNSQELEIERRGNATEKALKTTMFGTKSRFSRRCLLGTTAGLIAATLPKVRAAQELGQTTSDRGTSGSDTNRRNEIWQHEYWARKGDVSLFMFRKRLGSPQSASSLPVLFLAHGSSVSARPTFDLTVPGHGEYSMMDKFAEYGFDVWTMDFEGYGRSSRTPRNSDIASGAEDLKAASKVILQETGRSRLNFYGESSGALRVGAFAMACPERVDRLLFVSLTWTGQGSPTLTKRANLLDFYRTHNTRARDREMITSIFTRDKPGTSDPAVAEAMADAEMKFGDTVPTGSYLDMITKLPIIDPTQLHMPVLLARGEYDGIATEEDVLNFFSKLRTSRRELVFLPGASHAVALGINRRQLWYVMRSFLNEPPRLDV
jgi:alpha-beta hydrolase superfamily lysophospholipase